VSPTGRRMLQAARITLHELRDALADINKLEADHVATIRLSSQCSTNYQWLPDILRSFRQSWPATDVTIEPVPDNDHIDALLDHRLDLALITKLDRQMDRVRLHRLFDDELLAIVALDHPWTGQPFVTAEDFSGVHLVLFDSYDPKREPPVPLPIPPGATPGRLTTLPMVTDLLIETVSSTASVTVLPSWIAAPYIGAGTVRAVQLGPSLEQRTWYCATRHGPLPAHLDTFVEVLSDALSGRGKIPMATNRR